MTDSDSDTTAMTDEDIITLGREVRSEYDQTLGNCYPIAERLQERAREEYGVRLGMREIAVGEARETHFVNTLDASAYAGDVTDGLILIDAAIDQFCQSNWTIGDTLVNFGQHEWLPEVAIYPPGEEERHIWYYRPNDPEEGNDVFTGEPMDG